MNTSSRKAKGRTFQYYICNKIAELFNVKFDQQDEQSEIHSKEMGLSGVDVVLRGEIYNKFPYSIECKNCEKPSMKDWIIQAKNNTKENRNFLLFWKTKQFKKSVVILDTDVFFEIIRQNLQK